MACSAYILESNQPFVSYGTVPNLSYCSRFVNDNTKFKYSKKTHCCYIKVDSNSSVLGGLNASHLGVSQTDFNYIMAFTALICGYLIMKVFK